MHKKVTPVPIPNTVVKLLVVDDTGAISAGKVDWSHQYNSLLIIHIYIITIKKQSLGYTNHLFMESLTLAQDER